MNRPENNWLVTGNTTQWETLSQAEFDDLLQYASVPNDGIDVLVVRDFTGGTGISPRPGDCTKGGDSDGLVIDRRYDADGNLYWRGVGQTLAHEAGHYFSLEQTNSGHTPSNAANGLRVMHPTFRENRTVFVWDEHYDAYDHCMLLLLH